MKRPANQVIWRSVVVAGAMLGTPACKSKPANTTPNNTATQPPAADQAAAKPDPNAPKTGTADPCTGDVSSPDRPRGADDDGGGGVGRGFILS
ncbi:MAG: hypothetical protein QM831_40740 [Kofleriaceae bacterium]